jgi:predicted dehydrogenase
MNEKWAVKIMNSGGKMIKIGLIGYGYWGPNLARNFSQNSDLQLTAICDSSDDRLTKAGKTYPETRLFNNLDDFFNEADMDVVAVATPVASHFYLAKRALTSGRHVWMEKPMTDHVEQAEELIELAIRKNKVLLVDHTFVYTGAVRKIKELIDGNELGEVFYYDSTRMNLGLFQQDVNVIWDLAPHDISILDYLMPLKKLEVAASGCFFLGNGICPKSLLTIYMENGVIAHINVSWVSPVKMRQTMIGGTKRMVFYDDNEPSEKIKVYDKGVDLDFTREDFYKLKVLYRVGDMWAPKLESHEALAMETSHFVDCLLNGTKPLTDGNSALEVVKVLVASQKSLKNKGIPVELV